MNSNQLSKKLNTFITNTSNKNIMLSDQTIGAKNINTAKIMARPLTLKQREDLTPAQLKEEDLRLEERDKLKFCYRLQKEVENLFSD